MFYDGGVWTTRVLEKFPSVRSCTFNKVELVYTTLGCFQAIRQQVKMECVIFA